MEPTTETATPNPAPATEAPRPAPRQAKPSDAELRNRFFYHPPKTETRRVNHSIVSEEHFKLAKLVTEICPPGRCLSLALTKLEEARMWANAALAIESPTDD